MAAAARGGLKCLECCGYCCQAAACGVETLRAIWNTITKVCTCGQGWQGMLYNGAALCTAEEDSDYKDCDIPQADGRKCTDMPAAVVFFAMLVGMCVAMNRGLAYGKPEVYTNGVDSWGNICGWQENIQFSAVDHSGTAMDQYKKILIANILSNPNFIATGTVSNVTRICVKACPVISNDFTCTNYLSQYSPYESSLQSSLCGSSPNLSVLVFSEENNHCIPTGSFRDTSIQIQNAILNLYGGNWLHNVVHDCGTCAAELTWLILIAIGFTMLFTIVMHSAASALCLYSFATFFFVGAAATGYMWYLFSVIQSVDAGVSIYSSGEESITGRTSDNDDYFQNSVVQAALRLFPSSGNFYLQSDSSTVPQAGYSIVFRDAAIYSTVVVVVFSIVCIAVSRRNIDACAYLFEEAIDSLLDMKWVYLLPLFSIMSVVFAFGLWMYTVTYITAVFLTEPSINNQAGIAKATYVPDTVYTTGVLLFEFLSIAWIFNFVLACQHIITCLAVGTWYYTVDKSDLYRPLLIAFSRLIRKHLGSAVAGSFLVGFFGILRSPLSFLQSRLVSNLQSAQSLKNKQKKSRSTAYSVAHSPVKGGNASQSAGGRSLQMSQSQYTEYYSDAVPAPSGHPYTDPEEEPYYDSVPSQEVPNEEEDESNEEAPYTNSKYNNEKGKAAKKSEPDGYVAVEVWKTANTACSPFFWLLNNVLVYLSDLNYSMVALRGSWFLQSGRVMRDRLEEHKSLKGIPAIASFALFLGKITVTLTVLPIGFLLLKDKDGVFMYGYPLAVGALLSYLIAHIFISLFEAAVGAVFVCYLEDITINEGTTGNPLFGRKQFFRNFENAVNLTSAEAGTRDKVHHDETVTNRKHSGRQHLRQTTVERLSEDSGYSNLQQSLSQVYHYETSEPTRKPKSNPPTPIFELMPKKQPIKANKPSHEHDYDAVYSETYSKDEMMEEAMNVFDELDHSADESRKKKRNGKNDKKGNKNGNKQKDKQESSQQKKDKIKQKPDPKKTEEQVKKHGKADSKKVVEKGKNDTNSSNSQGKRKQKEKQTNNKNGNKQKDKQETIHQKKDEIKQKPDPKKTEEQVKTHGKSGKKKVVEKGKHDTHSPKGQSKREQKDKQLPSHQKNKIKQKPDPKKTEEQVKTHGKADKKKVVKKEKHDTNSPKGESKSNKTVKQSDKLSKSKHKHDEKLTSKVKTEKQAKKSNSFKSTHKSTSKPGSSKSPNKVSEKHKKMKSTQSKVKTKNINTRTAPTKSKMKAPKLKIKSTKPKFKTKNVSKNSTFIKSKVKVPKLKKLKPSKMKFKANKGLKFGKGLKKAKIKMPKTPKMKLGKKMNFGGKMKKFKIPKMRMRGGMRARGGRMGPGDVMGGVQGAMNVTDGLLRITGKKDAVENQVEKEAFGTRKRAKASTLASHVLQNRFKAAFDERKSGLGHITQVFNETKDLFVGGQEALADVDKQWDEIDSNKRKQRSKKRRT
ncbi:uncharacterized protein LOC143464993 isoform X2 [Clavelina lepadiformis]|uniref:uncharacterized protein LOC143464993 isoform X2 n=1 Tax=Clavelina lepadiformis TaxID=159417 RepID=UPI00404167B9